MMKRIILTAIATGLAASALAGTATIYVNNGTVTTPPMIDAISFVNNGSFSVFGATLPFDFSNVRNFTNRNLMNGFPGFRFDTAPSGSGQRKMAANFYNAGFGPNVQNASVTASAQLLISATNVTSHGTLTVGASGLLSVQGKNVDLSRGFATSTDGPTIGPLQRLTDLYWGFGTNRINPVINVNSINPVTPAHQVISLLSGIVYFTNLTVLSLPDFGLGTTPSLTSAQLVSEADSNRTVQIVFVRNNAFNPDPNLNVQISIVGGTPTELGMPVIEWSAASVNSAGQPVTNFLYLTDQFGLNPTNAFITNGVAPALRTYRPVNYSILLSPAPLTFLANPLTTAFTDPPPEFWGTPLIATNRYSAYSVGIDATSFNSADPDQARISPGRIEITADKTLDLTQARIDSPNYLSIQSTNHFKGASNALISAPYSDIALGSTNGVLQVAGLLAPIVPRISGTVSAYSAVWTNDVVFADGTTNRVAFNVLYVDSTLSTEVTAQQLDVSLRSTNLVIADTLNVLNNLSLDTDRLTIAGGGAINLQSPSQNWVDNAPHIKSLTNLGSIFAANELFFVSRNASGVDVPYRDFVNRGQIAAAGNVIMANNVYNSGFISSFYGQIFIQGGSNVFLEPGGFLDGFSSDIVIEARNLFVTNHFLFAGRSLSLSVTNSLVSGPNFWQVNDGFNLWRKPVTGDLSETEIYDIGFPNTDVLHTWAGADLGPTAAGYTNNAALGVLRLDGGLLTLFTFSGTGPSSNALYVDVLYLMNEATNRDAGGDLTALKLNPGMKLYFSQAFIDDGFGGLTDITAELAGKHGGSLVQLAHAGPLTLPKPALSFSAPLKVRVELAPTPRSLVTWDTTPLATNHLYWISHPGATNWQVVTNFVSGPAGGPVTVADPVLQNSRFYKVRVDVPAH